MLRIMTQSAIALAVLATPIAANAQYNDRDDRDYRGSDRDYRDDDRDNVSRGEIRRDRERAREERQEFRDAARYGNLNDVREERREYFDARRELKQDQRDWRQSRRYDYNRPDPRYGRYYADNYYRDGRYYRPSRMSSNDRIYRGRDGRHYCRRADGTTGLIIGAIGGGVLGNAIAPGGSKTLGAILGGTGGALLGRSIDRNNVSCR